MPRLYDHIDLRVDSLAEARPFYESLLPALGFTTEIPGWLQYEAEALGTSRALVGRMKPTTPPFLKIPAGTAWNSATARRR
jgi:hypothetical protein